MKRCPRCGEEKPLDGFFKNKARKGGLSGYCRPCQTAANNGRTAALRSRAIDAIGGPVCVGCGFADVRALTIDHKDGGGAQHRREVVSSNGLYRAVILEPHKYQCLCHNCNWIKRHENDEVRLAITRKAGAIIYTVPPEDEQDWVDRLAPPDPAYPAAP